MSEVRFKKGSKEVGVAVKEKSLEWKGSIFDCWEASTYDKMHRNTIT
jgi:hypothetical protein